MHRMTLKNNLWLQIATAIQISGLFFAFSYIYPNNLDNLAFALFTFYLLLLLQSLRKNQFLLQMTYACFSYLIIMPFLIQSSDQKYMAISNSRIQPLELTTFWIFVAVGLLIHIFYWLFSKGGKAHAAKEKLDINTATKNTPVDTGIIPLLGFLVLYILLYFGLDYEWMLSTRAEISVLQLSSIETLLSFSVKAMPSFIGLIVVERAVRRDERPNLAILLCCYLLLLIFNNPVNTPRFISLGCLALPALPYLVRWNWIGVLFVFFPAISSIFLPLTSLMRNGLENVDLAKALEFFGTAEFSAMFVFNDAIRSLRDVPLALGNNTLSALLVFVPRSIWPSKNPGTGVEVAERLNYQFTNVGIPPVYDFYLDFGLFGIALFSLFLALIISKMQRILDEGKGNSFLRVLPFITFVLIPIFLRGDFSTACVVAYSLVGSYILVASIFSIRIRNTKNRANPPYLGVGQ